MTLDSLHFLAFIFVSLLAFTFSPSLVLRKIVFSIATGYFFGSYFINDVLGAAILFVTLALSYLAIVRLVTHKTPWLLWVSITGVVLLFPAILYSSSVFLTLGIGQKAVTVLGYAYILLKLVHMLTDAYQGVLKRIPIWDFVVYNLSFLTLVAGPIQRFGEFQTEWAALGNTTVDLESGYRHLHRIANGYLQMVVLSPLVRRVPETITTLIGADASLDVIAFYTRPVYLYLNFAGYTSIVIGIGLLFGFKLPENFNKPWRATDFLDLWQRWHITLTNWMRDYVFTPLYKLLLMPFRTRQTQLAIMLYFITFVIQGLWHRINAEFVLYALTLGFGAALAKAVQVGLAKRLGKKQAKAFTATKQFSVPYFVLNYHIFAISMYFIQDFL